MSDPTSILGPYGKIRPVDIPSLETAIGIFNKHGLCAGIHGTSLWNPRYKDIDLIVVHGDNEHCVPEFLSAIEEIKTQLDCEVVNQNGNASIGYDLEIRVNEESKTLVLHVSYVVLL